MNEVDCSGFSNSPKNITVYARVGERDYCMIRYIMRLRRVNASDALRESIRLYYSMLANQKIDNLEGESLTIIIQNPSISLQGVECQDVDIPVILDKISNVLLELNRIYIDLHRIYRDERDTQKKTALKSILRRLLEAKKKLEDIP